jgi:hypothetical protein
MSRGSTRQAKFPGIKALPLQNKEEEKMGTGNKKPPTLPKNRISHAGDYQGKHRPALAARTSRHSAARPAGSETGLLSYAATQQLRASMASYVVRIKDPKDQAESTGFFINNAGMILTCWHVMQPGFIGAVREGVEVEFKGKKYQAQLLRNYSNRNQDLAVLQIQGQDYKHLLRQDFSPAPLAFPFQPADPVAALGYQRQDRMEDALLLRGYIDPENTPLTIPLTNARQKVFARLKCLGIIFRRTHSDAGMSGAPLLDTRSGCVVGVMTGVLDNQALFQLTGRWTPEPLGFGVPLSAVPEGWRDFASACNVFNYEPALDNDIVPQSKEFLRHESFTERPHWAALVEEFLHDPQRRSGYLLFVGGEGEGKSAFAAHCIQNTIEPIFHFVRRHESEPGWADPERMLRSLIAQLLRKNGGEIFGQPLLDRLSAPRSEKDVTKVLAASFADMLERLSLVLTAEDKREVIWIDGLDEAFGPTGEYHDTPGLPGLLPAQLPPGIYGVLTSRPGDHLHWLREEGLCQQHLLEAKRATNIADVQHFFMQHANDVDPPLAPDFIARAATRTQGNFYIAVQKLAEIKRHPTAPRDPEAMPASVEGYHAEVYQRVKMYARRKRIREGDVRLLLGLLAEARESLTPNHLEAFDLSDGAEQILEWAADYFRQRPVQRAPHLPFEFNHISIPEFLSGQLTRNDRRKIHRRLAEISRYWHQLDDHARHYALRHLPSHLIATEQWDELCDVLTDFEYLQTALGVLPATAAAAEAGGQGGTHA